MALMIFSARRFEPEVLGVDPGLQQVADFLLAVVARFDRELVLAEHLGAQGLELGTSAGSIGAASTRASVVARSASASAWRCSTLARRSRAAPSSRSVFDADLLQLGELAVELLEEVGGGFERAALVLQRGDLAGDAVPVELVEGGEFFQPGEGVEAAGEGPALGVDTADLAASSPRRASSWRRWASRASILAVLLQPST